MDSLEMASSSGGRMEDGGIGSWDSEPPLRALEGLGSGFWLFWAVRPSGD